MDYVLINSYFPFENNTIDQLTKYRETIAYLSRDIELHQGCSILIIGDLNADPKPTRFWREVQEFCSQFKLSIADLSLPSDSFTYLSAAHDTTSWLDHVLTSRIDQIINIRILHYLCIVDHFPLSIDIKFDVSHSNDSQEVINPKKFVNWLKINRHKYEIRNVMDKCFHDGAWENDLLDCPPSGCNKPEHKQRINELYDYLINYLLHSTEILNFEKLNNFKAVPGWNSFRKEKYATARYYFLQWKEEGMVKSGTTYDSMKYARTEFRNALLHCRRNEESIREARTISAFNKKDFKTFWKHVCVKKKVTSTCIDGISDKEAAVEIFRKKFFSVLDDKYCQSKPDNFDENFSRMNHSNLDSFILGTNEIANNISNLRPGIGNDNIHTNHLLYATDNCLQFITHLFNAIIAHSHFPKRMLSGEIRPIIKHQFGNKTDSVNYRPVMVSSHLLKLFEYCIQPSLSNSLHIHNNQFGFRKNTSTLMTVTVVKEIIGYYNNNNSNVFASFIDHSMGFDKVNQFKLLQKIYGTNLNNMLKIILNHFILNQSAYVVHDNCKSGSQNIGNGVRQGAINSPLLFNFYLCSMVNEVCDLKIGCKVGLNFYPLICYADDLVLMAPSQSALQSLLNKVYFELSQLSLTINATKTKVMLFKSKRKTTVPGVKIYINSAEIEIVQSIKYLGIILSTDKCNKLDLERLERAFLRQSFGCLNKFSGYPKNVKIFLFRTYCTSLYGSELWDDLKGCSQAFSSFKINFHKAIKRLIGVSFRSSNHEACISAGMHTLDHIMNFKMFNFGLLIKNSKSPCLKPIQKFLLTKSRIINKMILIGKEKYGVNNILEFDKATISARISFVFNREPRYQGHITTSNSIDSI